MSSTLRRSGRTWRHGRANYAERAPPPRKESNWESVAHNIEDIGRIGSQRYDDYIGGAAESYEEFELWDFALHHEIVAASRNPLLVAMYTEVERARRGEIWGNLKRLGDSRERRAVYHAEHAQLVDALSARELARAIEVMEGHLATVEANLLGAAQQADG